MAWTQADLDNIEDLIAAGVQTTVVNGRTVTYGDLIRIRREMKADIDATSALTTPYRQRFSYGRRQR